MTLTKPKKRDNFLKNTIAESIANAAVAKVSQNYCCIGGASISRPQRDLLKQKCRKIFRQTKKEALAKME